MTDQHTQNTDPRPCLHGDYHQPGQCTEANTLDERSFAVAGLHHLADFLSTHPDVPLPRVTISGGWRDQVVLVAWIDGLDTIDVQPHAIDSMARVVRRFLGLDVSLTVDVEIIGETQDVPSTKVELVPFTVEQIRQRAAERGVAV